MVQPESSIYTAMSKPRKTPKEIEDYVIAHINDRPRTLVAQHCGISMSTVYSIVRANGGELKSELTKKHEGIEDQITRMWPTMSASEIAKELGIGKTSAARWAKKLGLHHTPETIRRLQMKFSLKLDYIKRQMDYNAIHAKRSRSRRIDEWRVMSGLPQRTKFKVRTIPRKVYAAMWNLQHKYNYFFEPGTSTLYYDSQTDRRPNEQYYIDKYGIKFEQADE